MMTDTELLDAFECYITSKPAHANVQISPNVVSEIGLRGWLHNLCALQARDTDFGRAVKTPHPKGGG